MTGDGVMGPPWSRVLSDGCALGLCWVVAVVMGRNKALSIRASVDQVMMMVVMMVVMMMKVMVVMMVMTTMNDDD